MLSVLKGPGGLIAAALALAVAGCAAGSGTIPQGQANDLTNSLNAVASQVPRNCQLAQTQTLPQFEAQVASLSPSLDSTTRQSLAEGTAHLHGLVADECHPSARPSTTSTSTSTTPRTRRTTTPTTTTPRPTTTTTQTQPPTQTQSPTPPPTSNSGSQSTGGLTLP